MVSNEISNNRSLKSKTETCYSKTVAQLTDRCTDRSSQQRFSIKKGALKNFAIFIGKHVCLRPATSSKK